MATVFVHKQYVTTFNTPRNPVHHKIIRGRILGGLRRIWRPLDGIGFWNPVGDFDLVHSINRIPLVTTRPWMISFESVTPRTYGRNRDIVRDFLREKLFSSQCKGVVAISEYAIRKTIDMNAGWSRMDELKRKLRVIHPNIEVVESHPSYSGGTLSLVFAGNHFARKGGPVALRIAKLAKEKRLPVHVHVVSAMDYGAGVYTDVPDRSVYDGDLKNLALDNVTFHQALPNPELLDLIAKSHFVLLPTLHDTYGFSPLEGMARAIPAIGSATAAVPEFVIDRKNGFLLPIENDSVGDWIHLQDETKRWDVTDAAFDAMTKTAIECIQEVLDTPGLWNSLSQGAIDHIAKQHDAVKVGAQLEDLYSKALQD